MKRQELIHVHALLLEVRGYLETAGLVSTDGFRRYDAQAVRPSHVHRRKTDHQQAIALLLDGFDALRSSTALETTTELGHSEVEELESSSVRPRR